MGRPILEKKNKKKKMLKTAILPPVSNDLPRVGHTAPCCAVVPCRREAVIIDLPMDNLVDSLFSSMGWTEVGRAAQACRSLHAATEKQSKLLRKAWVGLKDWRAMARATRTAWQSFQLWRDEAARLADEKYDETMLEELEALMSEEEGIHDLTDEEANFLDNQMVKNQWEQLLCRYVKQL